MSLWPCSVVNDMSEPHYLVDTSLGLFLPSFVDAALFRAPSSLQKAGGRVGMKVCLCLDVLSITEQFSGLSCCDVYALNRGGNLLRGEEVLQRVVFVKA